MPMAINNDKALKTCMGTPTNLTSSGWVKPELGVMVPPLSSKLSGTVEGQLTPERKIQWNTDSTHYLMERVLPQG